MGEFLEQLLFGLPRRRWGFGAYAVFWIGQIVLVGIIVCLFMFPLRAGVYLTLMQLLPNLGGQGTVLALTGAYFGALAASEAWRRLLNRPGPFSPRPGHLDRALASLPPNSSRRSLGLLGLYIAMPLVWLAMVVIYFVYVVMPMVLWMALAIALAAKSGMKFPFCLLLVAVAALVPFKYLNHHFIFLQMETLRWLAKRRIRHAFRRWRLILQTGKPFDTPDARLPVHPS